MKKTCFLILAVFFLSGTLWAEDLPVDPKPAPEAAFETKTSTAPRRIPPSRFLEQAAKRLDWPLEKLEPLEGQGFGRSEMITLVLIAKKSDKKWDNLIQTRQKGTRLRQIAEGAGLPYKDIFLEAQKIKKEVDRIVESLPPEVTPSTSTLAPGATANDRITP